MKKIGIYGGSYNPCHIGHYEAALKYKNYCDEVWILPCANHKFKDDLINPYHRINMLSLLFYKISKEIKISKLEIDLNHKNGTYELLNILSYLYPENEFILCIGEDCANEIHKWRNYEDLIKDYKFLTLSRSNFDIKEKWYEKNGNIFIKDQVKQISSTNIRNILKEYYIYKNSSIMSHLKKENEIKLTNLLTDKVFEYITENNLFNR